MEDQLVIVKNNSKPTGQDYDALRQIGLDYIQQFSKNIWTDYNIHDPGITSLEILCYAITDLSYRTSLPMEDLLARLAGDSTKDFFTAREIFPCNPVTFNDLRKKMIDITGVENAWVLPYTDPDCEQNKIHAAYFIKCNKNPKSIDLKPVPDTDFEARNIKGLYEFNLLLEEDAVLGDLNILSVDWELRDSTKEAREALIRFIFPLTIQKTYPVENTLTDLDKLATGTITGINVTNFDALKNKFDLTITLSSGVVIITDIVYHIRPVNTTAQMSVLETNLKNYITSVLPLEQNEIISNILSIFQSKIIAVNTIIDEVFCMYQRVRNLCEDVYRIGIVPSQELAVCADIETETGVDLEEILGKVYYTIDTFLTPPVRFYLLGELLESSVAPEDIFEGPLLRHGFLKDEELRKSPLFKEVHVSDLYNLIMSIEGVKTVKYLQITNYLNGIPQTDGEFWKIDLKGSYHLNLDRLRSKITFYKGSMPITADKQVADRIYHDLKVEISKPRLSTLKSPNDIIPPSGIAHKLDEHYSVQNDFPSIYGVGKDGIPAEADTEYKSKIKQMKGYLLFYDQLLANYLSQLSGLKNLYAVSQANHETYFSQPVYDAGFSDTENLNFYDTAPLLVDFNMPAVNIDDLDAYKASWKTFTDNPNNNYRKALQEITNSTNQNFDRQNRFLDHLLARFAESFSDYAMMMYKFTGNQLESLDKKTAEQIALEKSAFLKEYHVLSFNRGKGQFYKCCPVGDCGVKKIKPDPATPDDDLYYSLYEIPDPANPTGLHKRTTLMLGMSIHDNAWLVLNKFKVNGVGPYTFSIQFDNQHTLDSVNSYHTEKNAFEAIEKIVTLIGLEDADNNTWDYFQIKAFGGGHRIEVREDSNTAVFAVTKPVYASVEDAKEGYKKLKQALLDEGMHVFDHLLLRPLPVEDLLIPMPDDPTDSNFGFFPLCPSLNQDCDCPVTDYYSFRISVILPYWTERFRNIDFRKFAEQTIHRETPAHILPKFCWISMYEMHQLEQAYLEWFAENKKYKPDMQVLKDLLKKLIIKLNTLTNVYPEGHLHDCENPSTDNPVILNQTMLGTF